MSGPEPTGATKMPSRGVVIALAALVCMVVVNGLFWALGRRSGAVTSTVAQDSSAVATAVVPLSGAGAPGELPVLGQLPDFSLTRSDGGGATLGDLRGSVWVACFMFTRCPGPCPAMSQRFSELQRSFRKLDGVKLVSISVDPEHDSPEVLAKYATAFEADAQRWLFLTGEKAAIVRLSLEGFKLPAGAAPSLHSTRFALVDRQGRIRGYYDSNDAAALEQLRRDVRKLHEQE